jgi:nitroimidazol reductase NimA-like FMN-containing flavoprotein (pyridoxamine 5'-phosphate oxidase superfamily)
MMNNQPQTDLEPKYSSPGAASTPWTEGMDQLNEAQIYWISTVRADGRPHVTPLFALWFDGSMYFGTGENERKALNLAENSHCVIMTGCNLMSEGLDVVIEGDAVRVHDDAKLQQISALYKSKYNWDLEVKDGALVGSEDNRAIVFEVAPTTAFGFGKGDIFSQTRWRFS